MINVCMLETSITFFRRFPSFQSFFDVHPFRYFNLRHFPTFISTFSLYPISTVNQKKVSEHQDQWKPTSFIHCKRGKFHLLFLVPKSRKNIKNISVFVCFFWLTVYTRLMAEDWYDKIENCRNKSFILNHKNLNDSRLS